MSALPSSKRLFTVDEMHALHQQGFFGDRDRVELVQGELYVTPPPGEQHNSCHDRLHRIFRRSKHGYPLGGVGLRFDDQNEVEPDLVFRPEPPELDDPLTGRGDTLRQVKLIAEIAFSSHRPDLSEKVDTYSTGGIPEYLVVDVLRRQVYHFLRGEDGQLRCERPLAGDEVVRPRATPDVEFRVGDLF